MNKKLELVSGNLSIAIESELTKEGIPVLQVGKISEERKLNLVTGEAFLANTNDDILSIEFHTVAGVEVWLKHLFAIHQHLSNKE